MNARGHHLTSVLFHALNAVLVFALLRQLTGTLWRSLAVAAVFAVHPLHVESVVWVAERKDVLSGFCGLLSLLFYSRYARPQRLLESRGPDAQELSASAPWHATLDYALAVCFLALGLTSKAMLVTDYWPLQRFQPNRAVRLVMEKIPFFALAAVGSCVTLWVQRRAGATTAVGTLPLAARGANALISYCRYLGILANGFGNFLSSSRILACAASAGGGYGPVRHFGPFFVQRKRFPFLLTGWLLFFGMLVPVIGLVQVGEQSMADRYVYLPSLGVFVLAVWGGYELLRHSRHQMMALIATGLLVTIMCAVLTRQQIGYWQDSESLFGHALAVTANNHIAQCNLGGALLERGQFDEAINHFREAMHLRPDEVFAHNALGSAFFGKGQYDEAIGEYQQALRLRPDDPAFRLNLGNALYKKGLFEQAAGQYQRAIRLAPDGADGAIAHYNLGKALDQRGQGDDAIREYQEAVFLKPDYAEAHNNLGYALQAKGRIDAAIREYQEAIRLKPDYALARNSLAKALAMVNAPAAR